MSAPYARKPMEATVVFLDPEGREVHVRMEVQPEVVARLLATHAGHAWVNALDGVRVYADTK